MTFVNPSREQVRCHNVSTRCNFASVGLKHRRHYGNCPRPFWQPNETILSSIAFNHSALSGLSADHVGSFLSSYIPLRPSQSRESIHVTCAPPSVVTQALSHRLRHGLSRLVPVVQAGSGDVNDEKRDRRNRQPNELIDRRGNGEEKSEHRLPRRARIAKDRDTRSRFRELQPPQRRWAISSATRPAVRPYRCRE